MAQVAGLVHASSKDVVPVVNTTSAVNAVVNSLRLRKGDVLLVTNMTYSAVKSTVAHAASRAGADVVQVLPAVRLIN